MNSISVLIHSSLRSLTLTLTSDLASPPNDPLLILIMMIMMIDDNDNDVTHPIILTQSAERMIAFVPP